MNTLLITCTLAMIAFVVLYLRINKHISTRMCIIAIIVIILLDFLLIFILSKFSQPEESPDTESTVSTEVSEEIQLTPIEERYKTVYDLGTEFTADELKDEDTMYSELISYVSDFTMNNNYPFPGYIGYINTDSDGTHFYFYTYLGTQVYDCVPVGNKLYINFYGSVYNKGFKGIIYGNVNSTRINIKGLEKRLIRMGLNDFFTITDVTDKEVTVTSPNCGTHTLRI